MRTDLNRHRKSLHRRRRMTAGDPETRLRWRRLRFEPLEDRRLLAADSALSHWLPGLQLVDQDSSLSATSVLSGTIGHEASQSWETVAGLQTPSSLASFAYSGDVYWGARDLVLGPDNPGNHHFIVTRFFGDAPSYTTTLESGHKAVLIGGFNAPDGSGKLVTRYHDPVDMDAANDWFAGGVLQDPWDPELHYVSVPAGQDFDSFSTVLYELTTIYDNQVGYALNPFFTPGTGNCASYVNTIMAKAGVPEADRNHLGEFLGVDWGEELFLPPGHFSYIQSLRSTASSVPQGTSFRLDVTTKATRALRHVDFFWDSDNDNVLQVGQDEWIGTDWIASSNTWGLDVSTNRFPVGEHRIFARAWDQLGDYFSHDWQVQVTITAPDTTPPHVTLNGISSSFLQPTLFDTSKIQLSGTASDNESGIVSNGYEFHTARWQESINNWGYWTDHGRGASSQLLGPFDNGTYKISLTGKNGVGLESASTVGYFRVVSAEPNQQPRIDSLAATPHSVLQGETLNLTAYGVRDDQQVSLVEFYWDSNGSGQWEPTDALLGSDMTIVNQEASVSVSTAALNVGTQRFFARARDNEGAWTHTPATTTANVLTPVNQPPQIASLSASPTSVQAGQMFTLTASGVNDPDGWTDVVEFWWDSNVNGKWDTGDRWLHSDPSIVGGHATAQVWASFAAGTQRFFARARDNEGLWGEPRTTTMIVTSLPSSQRPSVNWVEIQPATLRNGQELTVQWSATDDVGVDHIGLYLYRGNGTTDAFKVDTTPYVPGGHPDGRLATNAFELPNTMIYRWTIPGNLPPANDYRLKVVAWDADELAGFRFTPYFSVTNDPARIIALSSQPTSVIKGHDTTVTFTANLENAAAADFVQFVWDVNSDGQVATGDSILGNGVISGSAATFQYNTSGLAPGVHQFLARVRLADGTWGNRVVRKLTVTEPANQPPSIGSLSASPASLVRGDTLTLTVSGLSDDKGIAYVQILWDADRNGDASSGDRVLGRLTSVTNSQISLTTDSAVLDFGPQHLLARAQDTDGAWTPWVQAIVTVNPPVVPAPFVGSLDPNSTFQMHALTLTLTATGVDHATRVLFYHDTNNNGQKDAADQLLGDDSDGSNGWRWRNSPANMGLPVGFNRFFAVAENEYGQQGNVVSTEVVTHPLDDTKPEANAHAADIMEAGGAFYEFQVIYTDNIAVWTYDFDDRDVYVVGPENLWSADAQFIAADDLNDGPRRVVTYRIEARGGSWDAFDNGEYRVCLDYQEIRDTNGNFADYGQIGTFQVAIPFDDTTTPLVQLDGLSDDINHPTLVTTARLTLTGTAEDADSGIAAGSYEFAVNHNDGAGWTGWVTYSQDSGYLSLEPSDDGLYWVYLAAANRAGLTGQSIHKYFVVDRTAPGAVSLTGLQLDTGASDSDGITTHRSATFSWTEASDGGTGVAGYWWSVDDPTPESGGTFTGSLSGTPLVTVDGERTFYVCAQDAAGNLGPVSSLPFTLDRAPPIVLATSPTNGTTVTLGPSAILVDFSEPMDPASLRREALVLGGAGAGSVAITGAAWVDANTARFSLAGTWGTGGVSVQLNTGQFRDVAGNTLADYADGSFAINAAASPEIQVETPTAEIIIDGNFLYDFGSVILGDPAPAATFTVTNLGDAALLLDSLSVPPGFLVTEGLDAEIGPGLSDTFTVALDASQVGPQSGQISFVTNDPDESPFNFQVAGQVLPSPDTGLFGWAFPLGAGSNDVGYDIDTDAQGNVYVAGCFSGTVDFDPGPGTTTATSNNNYADIFVAKYSPARELIWVRTFGGTSEDLARSIDVDSAGNVFVTGEYRYTVDFDPGHGTANLTTVSGSGVYPDTFILRLTAEGNYVWAKSVGGVRQDTGRAIRANGTHVYVGGDFSRTADFDPGPGVYELASTANPNPDADPVDGFLLQLDYLGNLVWVKQLGGIALDVVEDLDVDDLGNVYATGIFHSTANFDPGGTNASATTNGKAGFVIKRTANGSFDWVRTFTESTHSEGLAIAVDDQRNVVMAGDFVGTVDFDPGTGVRTLTANSIDGFLLKLTSEGNYVWVHQVTGSSYQYPQGVVIDGQRNVYTAGFFYDTAEFNPGGESFSLTTQGSYDAFIMKISATGEFAWARQLGGSGEDRGHAVAVYQDKVYTTGYFSGTADFDPGAGTHSLTSAGNWDAFVSQLVMPLPVTNQPPVLAPIGDRTVSEGSLLTLTADVTDPDGGQTHTFSVDPGAPAGVLIDPQTGALTWTPSEAQGPGQYQITVRVVDSGEPAFTETSGPVMVASAVPSPTTVKPLVVARVMVPWLTESETWTSAAEASTSVTESGLPSEDENTMARFMSVICGPGTDCTGASLTA